MIFKRCPCCDPPTCTGTSTSCTQKCPVGEDSRCCWMITRSVVSLYLGCFSTLAFLERKPEKIPILQKWPFVSVVIPAHNRGNDLRACLTYVLAMTKAYEGKTEVIVINDGSTDNAKEI